MTFTNPDPLMSEKIVEISETGILFQNNGNKKYSWDDCEFNKDETMFTLTNKDGEMDF